MFTIGGVSHFSLRIRCVTSSFAYASPEEERRSSPDVVCLYVQLLAEDVMSILVVRELSCGDSLKLVVGAGCETTPSLETAAVQYCFCNGETVVW
jgi:hypothetical protein